VSKIALSGDASGTGTFTIASPNSNSNYTLTLPANTGTLLTTASTFAGTGPAFRATLSANQSISTGTRTKVALNTETFDTNNNYDNTTNYRFTPTVAGYYQVNGVISFQGTTVSAVAAEIRKNGTSYTVTYFYATNDNNLYVGDLVYMNGSTDYVELWGQVNAASGALFLTDSRFSASMVRAA
jgi:hypothetical protein